MCIMLGENVHNVGRIVFYFRFIFYLIICSSVKLVTVLPDRQEYNQTATCLLSMDKFQCFPGCSSLRSKTTVFPSVTPCS